MEELKKMITDEQLEKTFAYANFGDSTKRDVVRYALMKVACGYHNGHTSQSIINELGLCTKKLIQDDDGEYTKEINLTKAGQQYLYQSFKNGTNF